jgi:hypothetical protein
MGAYTEKQRAAVVESEQWNVKLLRLCGGFFEPRPFERADHAFVTGLVLALR